MTYAVMRALQYDIEKSVNATRNVLFQSEFLQDVVQRLDNDPLSVIADLNAYREACKYSLMY